MLPEPAVSPLGRAGAAVASLFAWDDEAGIFGGEGQGHTDHHGVWGTRRLHGPPEARGQGEGSRDFHIAAAFLELCQCPTSPRGSWLTLRGLLYGWQPMIHLRASHPLSRARPRAAAASHTFEVASAAAVDDLLGRRLRQKALLPACQASHPQHRFVRHCGAAGLVVQKTTVGNEHGGVGLHLLTHLEGAIASAISNSTGLCAQLHETVRHLHERVRHRAQRECLLAERERHRKRPARAADVQLKGARCRLRRGPDREHLSGGGA
eukprot:CAMPEP_0180083698 /NCGR_PEP_ID=MMETSP0985-20121206/19470_1 /TAXON_ID=483367 /ORGANISM="non described non described, Strain CCMP 2436" /LENGTH=264 /DNA_ID=CAMNT_0022017317 /DNA_START=110 /DNA_END=905 /DNA_ORIENTATION=+